MVSNKQMIYNETPVGVPVPGKTLKLVTEELDLEQKLNGGVIVKTLALSLDPYMRGRMREPSVASYASAYELGKPINGFTVGEVVRSESADHPVGTHLYGFGKFAEYAVLSPGEIKAYGFRIVDNSVGLPWTTWVGGAGMSGQTAFWSFYEIGKPKAGETIFVSAASGAVGQVVCQLAKTEGLKVVGSAGSDDKVEFLKALGVDVAFNYRKESTLKILEANPPDIFFDNVGGETLDAALATMNTFGRIIACGALSEYNLLPSERYAIKNYINVVAKQITYQGFIISGKNMDAFFAKVPRLIKDGKLKIKEHVTKGLDDGQAFVDMLDGTARGKAVISLE